jgi:hypothetical protein
MTAKRGRKSPGDLQVIPLVPGGHHGAYRLQPPPDLDPKARAMFVEIVASCPDSHFVSSDRALLATCCMALTIAQSAARDVHRKPAALAIWEKSARLLATLASKLRLCPSSRLDPKTAGRAAANFAPPSYYDLQRQQRDGA